MVWSQRFLQKHDVIDDDFSRQTDKGEVIAELPNRDWTCIARRQTFTPLQLGQHLLGDPSLDGTFAGGLLFQFFTGRRRLQRQVGFAESDLERTAYRLELRFQHAANFLAKRLAVLAGKVHRPAWIRVAVSGTTQHEQRSNSRMMLLD